MSAPVQMFTRQTALFLWSATLAACVEPSAEAHLGAWEWDTLAVLTEGADSLSTFGSIRDAVWLEGGAIAVLDEVGVAVHVFDSLGSYLHGLERIGEGPGELSRPRAIARASDGALLLYDSENARVTTLRLEEGHLVAGQVRPVLVGGPDFCEIDGTLRIHALSGNRLIHGVDTSGSLSGSILEPDAGVLELYSTLGVWTETAKAMSIPGRISCNLRDGSIVVAEGGGNVVTAVSPSGAMRWRTRIPDANGTTYTVTENGGLGLDWERVETMHFLRAMHRLPGDTLLLQFAVRSEAKGTFERGAPIESVFLKASDGMVLGRTMELPLLAAVSADRLAILTQGRLLPTLVLARRKPPDAD